MSPDFVSAPLSFSTAVRRSAAITVVLLTIAALVPPPAGAHGISGRAPARGGQAPARGRRDAQRCHDRARSLRVGQGAPRGGVARAPAAALSAGPGRQDGRRAGRPAGSDPGTVERLLDELQELGYLDLEERAPRGGQRAWLTDEGYDLVNVTEDALLSAARSRRPGSGAGGGSGRSRPPAGAPQGPRT